MFSFHKPKIYRSNLGCCICKAKSSSSRFTDSKKYENEFERCFRIQEKRSGEICNACVLLVKRWKKLSPENRLTKHWHHVVDARAGPGTKLTGNRRIINHQAGSSQASSSRGQQGCKQSANDKSDVLPLSSSQANNQSSSGAGGGPSRVRTSSLSKARAIDTNVSTFTFGEPPSSAYRRNYMTSEPASYSTYSSLSPMSTSNPFSLSKPQSALNSSAFESVIKRFRQRQQQQHLEAQRRKQNRQQRLLARQKQQQSGTQTSSGATTAAAAASTASSTSAVNQTSGPQEETDYNARRQQRSTKQLALPSPAKRVKRLSENACSLASYESLKVASILDSSVWRKETICCGIIFRGLYNEVAIFPKLLKPCECRLGKLDAPHRSLNEEEDDGQSVDSKLDQQQDDGSLNGDAIAEPISPPPRAAKSGSISSSTSGTGSMEQPLDDSPNKMASGSARQSHVEDKQTPAVAAKRPRSVPSKRRRQPARQNKMEEEEEEDCESAHGSGVSEVSNLSSKESASADSPGSATSSDNSSARMMLMIDGEHMVRGVDDEDDDNELVMAGEDDDDDDEALESSNDASSSVESLAEIEEKNPVTLPCNIYN